MSRRSATGRIRIGVGGWTYEPWRGAFYPAGLTQKRELEYASRKLTSIEINGTFYGTQRATSFEKWHDETPEDFVFSLKAPRFATHRRVLGEARDSIERFFASGVLALFIEFKTPGFGVFGVAGITLLAVVFLGSYVAGLSGHEPALLFAIGVVLLLLELLFWHSAGFLGAAGAFLMATALVWSMADLWPNEPVEFDGDVFTAPLLNMGAGLLVSVVLALLLARFLPIILPLAIAGALGAKRRTAQTVGTLGTEDGTFGLMLIATIVVFGALTFFPAAALGPIAEHLIFMH